MVGNFRHRLARSICYLLIRSDKDVQYSVLYDVEC